MHLPKIGTSQNKQLIVEKDGYVPNALLPGNYGDYLSLNINENGLITNWRPDANLSDFEEDDDD